MRGASETYPVFEFAREHSSRTCQMCVCVCVCVCVCGVCGVCVCVEGGGLSRMWVGWGHIPIGVVRGGGARWRDRIWEGLVPMDG